MMKMTRRAFVLVFAAFLANVTAKAKPIILQGNLGTFSSSTSPGQTDVYLVKAPQNSVISIQFDNLDFGSDPSNQIALRDGRKSPIWLLFTRNSEGNIEMREHSQENGDIELLERNIGEPLKYHSKTQRLFVIFSSGTSPINFSATYSTYAGDLCRKAELPSDIDGVWTCEGAELSPLTRNCSYQPTCGENYFPDGRAICVNKEWKRRPEPCQLRPELVDTCILDEDDAGLAISNCPYNATELLRYYHRAALRHDLGRSSASGPVKCMGRYKYCRKFPRGRYVQRCAFWGKIGTTKWTECLICRQYGCQKNHSVFN